MTAVDVEDRPSLSELGEPVVVRHGSERACREGECAACAFEQAEDEAAQR